MMKNAWQQKSSTCLTIHDCYPPLSRDYYTPKNLSRFLKNVGWEFAVAKICNFNSLPPIIMELGNGMEWVPQDFFPLQFRSFSTSMIMGGRVGSRVPIITGQPLYPTHITLYYTNPKLAQKFWSPIKTIQLHEFHSSKKKSPPTLPFFQISSKNKIQYPSLHNPRHLLV